MQCAKMINNNFKKQKIFETVGEMHSISVFKEQYTERNVIKLSVDIAHAHRNILY